jgi:hypothetical protein
MVVTLERRHAMEQTETQTAVRKLAAVFHIEHAIEEEYGRIVLRMTPDVARDLGETMASLTLVSHRGVDLQIIEREGFAPVLHVFTCNGQHK